MGGGGRLILTHRGRKCEAEEPGTVREEDETLRVVDLVRGYANYACESYQQSSSVVSKPFHLRR